MDKSTTNFFINAMIQYVAQNGRDELDRRTAERRKRNGLDSDNGQTAGEQPERAGR